MATRSSTRSARNAGGLAALSAVAALGLACGADPDPARAPAPAEEPAAAEAALSYVGGARCRDCHAAEWEAWRGSDHDLALRVADAESVLGDFDDARLEHDGGVSRFFRRGERFLVETEGPGGAPAEFEIAYAVGARPLQQYLIALPGGRLQSFGLAWDARPQADGGQRWYSLYPDEALHAGDPLHWTGYEQTWNYQCADCHSTNVRKGYDPASQSYATTWSELDVSCEACHGPGSAHVAWAEAGGQGAYTGLPAHLGPRAEWVRAPGRAVAERRGEPTDEVETCAPCHARRTRLREGATAGTPFLDAYRPALLDPGLYTADGQILDEVYVYGSFLQSRMYAAGVTCSDCHDAHRSGLRAESNALCVRCHDAARYDVPAHHRHAEGTEASLCVSCHMPARTYMGVDARRDHSLRIPRPDLSERLGTRDACTACHTDRTPAWARAALGARAGAAPAHYGEAIQAGRRGDPGARAALRALAADTDAPAIARATALRMLRAQPGAEVERALRAPEGLLRMAAAEASVGLAPEARWRAVAPLLDDPLRAVRTQAALALADAAPPGASGETRRRLEAALAEYVAAQRLHADRPEAHLALGLLHVRLGDLETARAEIAQALALDPRFVPALVNLADLQRQRGRDDEGERLLLRAHEIEPESAEVEYALGLVRVRRRRIDEALGNLARAVELAPDRPHYAYVYGVGLHSAGRSAEAVTALEAARARHPGSAELLLALATIQRDRGETAAARAAARALAELDPGNEAARALLAELSTAPSG